MKEITIYECEDGSRFDIKEKAERYDRVLEKVKQIMEPIGESVKESYSAKQRNKDAVENAAIELMHLCAWCIPDFKETFERVENLCDLQRYIVGLVLSDYNREWNCLYEAFYRFSCISSETYIEYEQPYWTTHEKEYKEKVFEMETKGK